MNNPGPKSFNNKVKQTNKPPTISAEKAFAFCHHIIECKKITSRFTWFAEKQTVATVRRSRHRKIEWDPKK